MILEMLAYVYNVSGGPLAVFETSSEEWKSNDINTRFSNFIWTSFKTTFWGSGKEAGAMSCSGGRGGVVGMEGACAQGVRARLHGPRSRSALNGFKEFFSFQYPLEMGWAQLRTGGYFLLNIKFISFRVWRGGGRSGDTCRVFGGEFPRLKRFFQILSEFRAEW